MKTISRLEVLHAWKTVTFLNSCHICPNNTSMPHNLSTLLLTSFRCFIELIFGGGWCILGKTALENSLQSNRTEKTESKKLKSTSHLQTPSIGQQQKGLLVTSTQTKVSSSHQPYYHLSCLVKNSDPLLQVETRMLTFVLDTYFMSAHDKSD